MISTISSIPVNTLHFETCTGQRYGRVIPRVKKRGLDVLEDVLFVWSATGQSSHRRQEDSSDYDTERTPSEFLDTNLLGFF